MVREITQALKQKKYAVQAISSDLEQKEREQALLDFKSNKTQILVATDILARGIDIKGISLVINYSVPQDAEDYVHRIGRTARADATGVALTFISDKDQGRFHSIEQLIEMEVLKIPTPKELGESPNYDPNKRPPRKYYDKRRNNNRGKGNRRYSRNKK